MDKPTGNVSSYVLKIVIYFISLSVAAYICSIFYVKEQQNVIVH